MMSHVPGVPPPWFQNDAFPLFLAPMAGVTDVVFRSLCKEFGADVMLTEFVSAEGVLRRSRRTAVFTDFTEDQRPLGIQFFGADGPRMAEAARRVIEWRRPDFIDLNFGCPVSKVVAKNGGSSLLKNLPALSAVARAVVEGVGDMLPVTAKIRTGWDSRSVNALEVCRLLSPSTDAPARKDTRERPTGKPSPPAPGPSPSRWWATATSSRGLTPHAGNGKPLWQAS